MPRTLVELEPFRNEIIELYLDNTSANEICRKLKTERNLEVSERTLKARLKEWDVQKRFRTTDSLALRDRILYLFKNVGLSDSEIVIVLKKEGFEVERRKLVIIRKEMNLRRRLLREQMESAIGKLKEVFEKEINRSGDLATARSFGIGFLHTYINTVHNKDGDNDEEGHQRVPYHHIRKAIQAVDPEGVERRYNEVKRARGDFVVPGPNFVWSIDGYCKLRFAGIEIYGMFDAYGRFVTELYCGISNDCAVSVLRQYIDCVTDLGYGPLHIRSDRGVETPMIADAHYQLHKATAIEEGRTPYEFSDVYWFGTSTANQRIEAWWAQLAKVSSSII
jgi:hypothetical protein